MSRTLLPDYGCDLTFRPSYSSRRDSEVEIARITLASVHAEVTSIRSRHVRGRIIYRVDDDTANEFGYRIAIWPRWSRLPLTMGQLIKLIDTARWQGQVGLVQPHWHTILQWGGDPDRAESFVRIVSQSYPQLTMWYRAICMSSLRTTKASIERYR